jgi:predicted secreted hydrolase
VLLTACTQPEVVRAPIVGTAPAVPGFARAAPDRPLQFPADHGAHPDYQTEWWYYTGNLEDAAGRVFGYQLTFFRRALRPPAELSARSSPWAANQIYMAHLTLTDVDADRQHQFERFSRGSAGLAGVEAEPYKVWLDDWSVVEQPDGTLLVKAADESVAIELALQRTKGPVAHGLAGYSQKGPDPGNASHYYSMPRLLTRGSVRVGAAVHTVAGTSWMDHEFGTAALAANQIGWDWFSLQLDADVEIMLFHIRTDTGEIDPFSGGTLIGPDSEIVRLARDDFELQVSAIWKSPKTGANYPSRWRLQIPAQGIDLDIRPVIDDQELRLSYIYWEGAVEIVGEHGASDVAGRGYVELTGYAFSMRSQI